MDLCNINDIKALLSRHGFRFSKSMGQNFLIEDWVPRDIADASGAAPGVGVVEVGPGIGPLTRELSLRADKVVSIELDRSLLPILAETLSDHPNAEIFPGDVLKTDLPAEVDDPKHFFQVVRAAFAQRRKTLLNSLSSALGGTYQKEAIANAIAQCSLPENIRGERLSISDFAALSKALRRQETRSL